MNKKVLIIIIASVLATAVLVTGAVMLLPKLFTFEAPLSETLSTEPPADVTPDNNDDTVTEDDDNSPTQNEDNAPSDAPEDADEMKFIVGNASGKKGKVVKVPVKIVGNTGFAAVFGSVEYDSAVLKYLGFSKGELNASHEVYGEKKGSVSFISDTTTNEDIKDNGTLLYLEFEIISKDKASADVTLNIAEDGICTIEEELVPIKTEKGTISIK